MTALAAHLAKGQSHVCRCWAIDRADGVVFGFTDHDRDLGFDGLTFRADSGMTAGALSQGTGLAVDNAEALGVLSAAAITEADIGAGRYDGASVRAWLVNWQDPEERELTFRGTIGEIRRGGGAFHAELRGLTEVLNQPQGRVHQKQCTAVLGDGQCGFSLDGFGFHRELPVETVTNARVFSFASAGLEDPDWFARGRLRVLSGAATGLWGLIKSDEITAAGGRTVSLWHDLGAEVAPGDQVRLEAGCDKRRETCAAKFDNQLNFRGFPDIPGDDWMVSVPAREAGNDGGSRR